MTQQPKQQVAVTDQHKVPLVAGGPLKAILPSDIDQAWRLSTIIANSGLAPKDYAGKPDAILVAIMHGMEVGLPPMAALQSIAVINGRPSIWGDGALALVRASGLLLGMDEILEGEGDNARAVCTVRRRGEHEPITRTFSVAAAKRAGLWTKVGPWSQYPQRMLAMRARSWALRDGFADVLRGLGMAEEQQDIETRQQSDGSYAAIPARPTRADFVAEAVRDVQEEAATTAEAERLNRNMDREAAGQPPEDAEPQEAEAEVLVQKRFPSVGSAGWDGWLKAAKTVVGNASTVAIVDELVAELSAIGAPPVVATAMIKALDAKRKELA